MKATKGSDLTQTNADLAHEMLELFYPIFYKVGMALESKLGKGELTRTQITILWLIRSEGAERRAIPRKRLERLVRDLRDVSGPAFTKALRALTRPPLNLLRLVPDPRSGREKQVLLTAKGERCLQAMTEQGSRFFLPILQSLPMEQILAGVAYLRAVVSLPELTKAPATGKR